jgi:hypothetical protein
MIAAWQAQMARRRSIILGGADTDRKVDAASPCVRGAMPLAAPGFMEMVLRSEKRCFWMPCSDDGRVLVQPALKAGGQLEGPGAPAGCATVSATRLGVRR